MIHIIMYVCVYIYIYIYIHTYIHTYIYTYVCICYKHDMNGLTLKSFEGDHFSDCPFSDPPLGGR